MSEHKEEFMMWRNKAGRNHWKHLTRKLRACFCHREEGMTNVSDCCLGQFFHLNKVTLISPPPLTQMCQGQFVQLQRIKGSTFAETMRPHYAHNLTSVNSLAQKCLVWKQLRDGSVPWLVSSEGKYNIRVVFKAELLSAVFIFSLPSLPWASPPVSKSWIFSVEKLLKRRQTRHTDD